MSAGVSGVDDILLDILQEADLERFADPLAEKLQVTKLEHFAHVKDADLLAIGLSHPAIKRLKYFVKEKKNELKRQQKATLKVKPGKQWSELSQKNKASGDSPEEAGGVTCLIGHHDIKLMETLGEGSFGVVKRATWRKSNGKMMDVAVKLLRAFPSSVSSSGGDFSEDSLQEINAMHALRHPNLIRLYGLVLSQPIMMVTELCEGGALLDRLRSTSLPVLLIVQLINYGVQIAKGMAYLESKLFIHRDLAARNVLLSSDEMVVKIGDFGLMRALPSRGEHYVMSGQKRVPFAWCPPEALKFRKFSSASDVWAFGVTLWEMFSFGEEPWCGLNGAEILEKVVVGQRLPQPDACPSAIFQLMLQCWSLDPGHRPTFAALKELLNETVLMIGKCKEGQTGEGLLELEANDRLIVINGSADSYYWYGQNNRTHKMGKFARKNVVLEEPSCPRGRTEREDGGSSVFFEMGGGGLTSNDISRPIQGSFVHTGHGDARGGACWGQPDKIDPIFLNNPLWIAPSAKNHTNRDSERRKTLSMSCADDERQDQSAPSQMSWSEDERATAGGANDTGGPRRNQSYHIGNSSGASRVHSGSNVSAGESSSTGSSSGFSGDSDRQPVAAKLSDASISRPYYSIVPPVENHRDTDRTMAPTTTTTQPYYDRVPSGEDPFEVPVQVKTLTNRQRYSEMYANMPVLPPPPSPKYSRIIKREVRREQPQQNPPEIRQQDYQPVQPARVQQDYQPVQPARVQQDYQPVQPSSVQDAFPQFTTAPVRLNPVPPNPAPLRSVQTSPSKIPCHFSSTTTLASHTPFHPQPPRITLDRPTALVHPPAHPQCQQANTSLMDELNRRFQSTNLSYSDYNEISSAGPALPSPSGFVWNGPALAGHRAQSVPDVNAVCSPTDRPPLSARKMTNADTHQILDLFDPLTNRPSQDLIERVRAEAPFASVDRCVTVLRRCQMNTRNAVMELKTEKLVDMGLAADRAQCLRALEMSNWDVNAAAEKLLG